MTLKSLAEIAFDAFQTFAPPGKQYITVYTGTPSKVHGFKREFHQLSDEEKVVFERIAGRVQAEITLRSEDARTIITDLCNSFETEGCEGCGTVDLETMNKARKLLGWEPLK